MPAATSTQDTHAAKYAAEVAGGASADEDLVAVSDLLAALEEVVDGLSRHERLGPKGRRKVLEALLDAPGVLERPHTHLRATADQPAHEVALDLTLTRTLTRTRTRILTLTRTLALTLARQLAPAARVPAHRRGVRRGGGHGRDALARAPHGAPTADCG